MTLAIFDIDGTLCDTFNVDDECFCAAASEVLGIPVGVSSWEGAPHITDAGVTDWLWRRHKQRPPTAKEIRSLAEAYEKGLRRELQSSPDRFRVMPGAPVLFEALPALGWHVAIATGGWRRLASLKLEASGIPAHLLLATSDDSDNRSEIFRLAVDTAARKQNAAYSRTVLVGDGIWDIRVAAKHGWCFLGVGRGERASRLLEGGAFAVVEDFSDFPAVLQLLESCTVPE